MTATVYYDEQILKNAVFAYVKKVYFKHLLWPTILTAALLGAALYSRNEWVQSMIAVTVVMIPSAVLLGYWMRIKQSVKILEQLDGGQVEFTLNDDGVRAKSAIGDSLLMWKVFTELWDTPSSKLLLYTNNQFITLPKDQVDESFFREIQQRLGKS